MVRCSRSTGEKVTISSESLPASMRERSSTSLISPSRWPAAVDTLPSRSSWAGSVVASRIRPVRPMMAFIGVRISWLMLARKALLARLLVSATSLAAASSAVRSRTSSSSRWLRVCSCDSLVRRAVSASLRWASSSDSERRLATRCSRIRLKARLRRCSSSVPCTGM
jgi:hypothetical protein